MKIQKALFFWLGSTDSRVASGIGDAGGTRDIRFCGSGPLIKKFTGRAHNADGKWSVPLAPVHTLKIPAQILVIAEYGFRSSECALPRQLAASKSAYPLWFKCVRPIMKNAPVLDAIALFMDTDGEFHARVIPRERVPAFPMALRTELIEFDECARLYVGGTLALRDDLFAVAATPPQELRTSDVEALAELAQLTGKQGRTETKAHRHRRSRKLAEKLKTLYGHKCQLCTNDNLAIIMADGTQYVEVHHIQGLAEADPEGSNGAVSQQGAALSLDHYKNLIVVCPFHHAMLHHDHRKFEFDDKKRLFIADDGTKLLLATNKHL